MLRNAAAYQSWIMNNSRMVPAGICAAEINYKITGHARIPLPHFEGSLMHFDRSGSPQLELH